ncbi:MAG: hypothetical protein IPO83_04325 [Chitinophagaceae bacterium]|nr:hypothetical protein [Chitinophagaceae bacterium]
MTFRNDLKHLGLLILFAALFLASCKKQEGKGGDASISGAVNVKHYNSTFTEFISEYPGADTYVYLIYGDDISYGQRIKTNYEGQFEFKYLYKGNYTLYVYSLDSTLTVPSGNVTVVKEVNIGGRKDHIDVGAFQVFQ